MVERMIELAKIIIIKVMKKKGITRKWVIDAASLGR